MKNRVGKKESASEEDNRAEVRMVMKKIIIYRSLRWNRRISKYSQQEDGGEREMERKRQ